MNTSVSSKEEFFKRLWDYVTALHADWMLYKALFDHSPARREEMNRRTGHVFRVFHDALADRIMLDTTNLLDKAGSGKQENLCLERAIKELPLGPDDRRDLRATLKAVRKQCGPILAQRHKRIAHIDRGVALGDTALPGVSRKDFACAIDTVETLLSDLRMAYDRGAYKWVGIEEDQEWEAAILMKVLQSGNSQMDAEQKARRGAYMTEFGISDLDEGFDPGEDWEQKSG